MQNVLRAPFCGSTMRKRRALIDRTQVIKAVNIKQYFLEYLTQNLNVKCDII